MKILNCYSWYLAFFSLVDTDTVVSTIFGLWGSYCPVFLLLNEKDLQWAMHYKGYWSKYSNEGFDITMDKIASHMTQKSKQYGKIRNLVRKDCSVYNAGGDPQNKISKNVGCSFKSYLKECKLLLSIPEDWVFKDCFCWGSVEEMKYSSLSFLK